MAHGLKNIPTNEGVIFVSNHPLGGMDAMAIVSKISPIRDDINTYAQYRKSVGVNFY